MRNSDIFEEYDRRKSLFTRGESSVEPSPRLDYDALESSESYHKTRAMHEAREQRIKNNKRARTNTRDARSRENRAVSDSELRSIPQEEIKTASSFKESIVSHHPESKKSWSRGKSFLVLLGFILVIAAIITGICLYSNYKYQQTYEYKLLEKGYSQQTVSNALEHLSDSNLEFLNNQKGTLGYIDALFSEKYFLQRNFQAYCAYYDEHLEDSPTEIVAIVNVGANVDWYTDIQPSSLSYGSLILVNKFHYLSPDYEAQEEMVNLVGEYCFTDTYVTQSTYDAFMSMAQAAEADGTEDLLITSGYRSYEEQEEVYNEYLEAYDKATADEYAARPGSSEHQTGYVIDLVAWNTTDLTFGDSKLYAWLCEHAYEYGFIERYQKGKEYLTGYSAETWHYRYVGIKAAKVIHDENITFDEYYAYYVVGDSAS